MLTKYSSMLPLLTLLLTNVPSASGQSVPATAPASAVAKTLTVPATLEAFESTDLFAKDGGYLLQVSADIGDHVKEGQVLAVIDDPELVKQIDIAKATIDAKDALAKAAQASLDQASKSRDVAQSQRAGYNAEYALAQATLKRQEELFASKAVTNQQLDEFRAKAQVAQAQADVAAAKVAAADADVAAAQANLAVAQAQSAVAKAELDRLQTLLQYTKITAPFEGIITRRLVSRGDLVQAGTANRATPLFTCQRIDTIRVFCDVPESNSAAIDKGTPAVIKLFSGTGQPISAAVTRTSMSLNTATRTLRAEIDLPNPGEKLRPGMYAQVTFTLSEAAATPRPPEPTKP